MVSKGQDLCHFLKVLIIYLFSLAKHNWNTMVEGIQAHIGSLNWGYRVALREKKVNYLNAFAEFIDPHTLKVEYTLRFN